MRAAIAVCAIVLAITIAYFLTATGNNQSTGSDSVVQQPEVRGLSREKGKDSATIETPAIPAEKSDCIVASSASRDPLAHKLDAWFLSWGAPPTFDQELATRPYAQYSLRHLNELIRGGDAAARHELGRQLVWQAFRNAEAMPDYETLWDLGSDARPYSPRIDQERLNAGRATLYQAALEGQLYALIDMSLSYAHELEKIESETNRVDERQILLRMNIYTFGEMVERLVPGLPDSFFQSKPPFNRAALAEKELVAAVREFLDDRVHIGDAAGELPVIDDEIQRALNLCLK